MLSALKILISLLNFRAEMEEIKKEILSLSEKYSIKCVESANLEEELKTANSQLAQAQQQIIQLDSRYILFLKYVKYIFDLSIVYMQRFIYFDIIAFELQ